MLCSTGLTRRWRSACIPRSHTSVEAVSPPEQYGVLDAKIVFPALCSVPGFDPAPLQRSSVPGTLEQTLTAIVRSGLMSVNRLYYLELRRSAALTDVDPDSHNADGDVDRGCD